MKAINTGLRIKTIEFRFFTEEVICMRHWIGAALRNRFLYEAEFVTDKDGVSLRSKIETLPIQENHFLYKQLKDGFPKGFILDCSNIPRYGDGFKLRANYIYNFRMILIGSFIENKELVIEAVKNMLSRGIGHPVKPMKLIDVIENDSCSLPYITTDNEMNKTVLELNLKTPVCLMHLPKESGNGFQNKLNNFPSFYQFMRSITYRAITLSILYSGCTDFDNRQQMDEWIEEYISLSSKAILSEANIRYEKLYCTPKVGNSNVYVMNGYTGKLSFHNVEAYFIPLLEFCINIGVGSDINFGLGTFGINYKTNLRDMNI